MDQEIGTRYDMNGSFARTMVCALLGAALLFGTTYPLSAQDILKEQKQRDEIQRQKLEEQFRETLKQTYEIAKSDPAKAVQGLKAFLAEVKASRVLTDSRRKYVTERLEARINFYSKKASTSTPAERDDNARKAIRNDEGRAAEPPKTSAADFSRMAAEIRRLSREGRTAEAARLMDRMRSRYGDGTGAATGVIGSRRNAIEERKALERMRGDRFNLAMRSVAKSAMPPIGDVEFPPADEWRKKLKRIEPRLTAKEKAILKALNTPITVQFKENSLEDVLNYLRKETGAPLFMEEIAMRELGIDYKTPITFESKGLTLRTVLRKILGDLGMSYYVKDETVTITSVERAKAVVSTRVYYLGDLVAASNFPVARFGLLGQQLNAIQQYQNVQQLIALVVTSVDPESWINNGGQGTIAFHPPTLSFIVKQSAEVHHKLGGGRRLVP